MTRRLGSWPARAAATRGVLLAAVLGAMGCAGPSRTSSRPQAIAPVGDLALLAPRASTAAADVSPSVAVTDALRTARAAIGPVTESSSEWAELDTFSLNQETDARTEAWLRVEMAYVLAGVAAAPSPPPRPVDVQRQHVARTERTVPPGALHLSILNTRERLRVQLYDSAGRMQLDAIREIARAFRDHRANRARVPDPRLLAMLYRVGQYYDAELEVVSAYRIRGENASRLSRHGASAACDFRIEGIGVRTLAGHLERTFANVGVGFYPTSGFVHLDNRPRTFYWVDYSGPGQRSRTRARSIAVQADPAADSTLRSVHISEQEYYTLPPAWRTFGYEP